MDKHLFKIVYSKQENVYRIFDLTDTALVGITEMFEDGDEYERDIRAQYINEMRSNVGLRARIVGYGIFVTFDDYNTKWVPVPERGYLLSVLRQMAKCFEKEKVRRSPARYEKYAIPHKKRVSLSPMLNGSTGEGQCSDSNKASLWGTIKQSKWLRGWRLFVIIASAIALILCIILLPGFWEFIGFLPFGIIMFFAYLDDMIKRR